MGGNFTCISGYIKIGIEKWNYPLIIDFLLVERVDTVVIHHV